MTTDGAKVTTRGNSKLKPDTDPAAPSLQSIDLKLNSFLSLLEKKNTSDIKDIKKEQQNMCASIEHCHANMQDLKDLLTTQDIRINKCENDILQNSQEATKIRNHVKTVEENVRDLEQYSHRNNLIVYRIPEEKSENIISVVRRLATALQFEDWSSNLIDAVHRMGKVSASHSRPIIIRFISRLDKDMFLSKRKVRCNLKASDLGYSSENNIYVNESLTPANRELLKKTREAARIKGYNSHVWTANCGIFTRKHQGAQAIRELKPSRSSRQKTWIVEVFSDGWVTGQTSRHHGYNPDTPQTRSILVEFLPKEPGQFAVSWMEISRRPVYQPTDMSLSDCLHRCPELDACINSSLWCDGVVHCPSGYDEALTHCLYLLQLPPLHLALWTLGVLAMIGTLLFVGCRLCRSRHGSRLKSLPSDTEAIVGTPKEVIC